MKKAAHRLSIVILSIFLLILTGCDGIIPDSVYVELNKPYSVLLIGETDQLEARIVHSNALNQNVVWASSDPGIATVSRTGLVTGVAAGTTHITAALGPDGRPATCEVTIAPMAHAAGVEIIPSTTVTLCVGQTYQYTAKIFPLNAISNTVIWTSTKPGVATISNNGQVTAVAAGWTGIEVMSEDGGFTAYSRLDVISTEVPVTGIVAGTGMAIFGGIGIPIQLSFTIYPSTATNKNVFWASTNPRIATISQSGWLTPQQYGDVDIVIMTEDGAYTDSTTFFIIPPPTYDPLMTRAR